jgi:hypothetical protein
MRTSYKTLSLPELNGYGINIPVSSDKGAYVVEIDGCRFKGYRGKEVWLNSGAAENAFVNHIIEELSKTPKYKGSSDKVLYYAALNIVNRLVDEERLVILKLKDPRS